MESVKKYKIVLPIILVCLYIFLRFWNFTGACLFFDEIFSVHAAKHSWDSMLWFVAQDLVHPPFFYVLLKIWILLGGESLFWLRLFPVSFSIIVLIPFALLCKELKLNYSSFVLSLTFFAVNGCLIKYAQEIRMYSLLLCFGLFSTWLFVRFLNQKNGLIWLIIVNILMVNTHYFGWLIVLSQVISILVLQRESLKKILMMFGLTGLSFLPWIWQIWQAAKVNANYRQNLDWAERPTFSTIYHFINDLIEPFYFQQTTAERAEIILVTAPLIFVLIVSTLLYMQNWREEKEKTILLIILLKLPIIIAFIASWIFPVSVWGTRHLILAFPLLFIFYGFVLEKVKIRELKIVFVSVVFFFVGFASLGMLVRGTNVPFWCSWENLAKNLPAENTKLYVFEDLIAYHVWSALGENTKTHIVVVKGIDAIIDDTYFLPRGFDEVKLLNINELNDEKFFVAFRANEFNEFNPPLSDLRAKGYKIGEPKAFELQNIKTFLVEVTKDN
jgi:uncharacterized membrane protein